MFEPAVVRRMIEAIVTLRRSQGRGDVARAN